MASVSTLSTSSLTVTELSRGAEDLLRSCTACCETRHLSEIGSFDPSSSPACSICRTRPSVTLMIRAASDVLYQSSIGGTITYCADYRNDRAAASYRVSIARCGEVVFSDTATLMLGLDPRFR